MSIHGARAAWHSAQIAALGVLHYDADFDVLATVLEFESRWIAPHGSL